MKNKLVDALTKKLSTPFRVLSSDSSITVALTGNGHDFVRWEQIGYLTCYEGTEEVGSEQVPWSLTNVGEVVEFVEDNLGHLAE